MLAPIGFNSIIVFFFFFCTRPVSLLILWITWWWISCGHIVLSSSPGCAHPLAVWAVVQQPRFPQDHPSAWPLVSSSLFLHCSLTPEGAEHPCCTSSRCPLVPYRLQGLLMDKYSRAPTPSPSGTLSTVARAHHLPPSVRDFFSLISMFFHLPDSGFCFFILYSLLKICLPSSSVELPFLPPLI